MRAPRPERDHLFGGRASRRRMQSLSLAIREVVTIVRVRRVRARRRQASKEKRVAT